MKKVAIIIVILLLIGGGLFFAFTKLKVIFGVQETMKDESGIQMTTLKKVPDGVKINFKFTDSCEKPGHTAFKFSINGLQKANIQKISYDFTYTDKNSGSLQGNGTTTPITVKNDTYEPMTPNCHEYGLFSCSAGGKCVFYKVSHVDGTYKFYFADNTIGVWKQGYDVK